MLQRYRLDGEEIDSLDLKALVVTQGVRVSDAVYREFGGAHRLSPDPLTCNCFLLPDQTVVQMTDVALHLRYLKSAMSLGSLKQLVGFLRGRTQFTLGVSEKRRPILAYRGKEVTEVAFPPKSHFYEQRTTSGLPFLGNAVLQGLDTLSYQCLWPCQYARRGHPCQFCYSGGITERLARQGKPDPVSPTARDAAEIFGYAVAKEKGTKTVQITGGSMMDPVAECGTIKGILREMDSMVGLRKLRGEMLVYTTPPEDPKLVDQVFDAGADRVACSLEVWDEKLAKTVTPGKTRFAGRLRFLNCLRYIAREYGPNKACSSFVVGVEPAESFLEGAEQLATEGIAAIASLWIPFGRTVLGKSWAPGLDYYCRVKFKLAEIYDKYGIEPPGEAGFNVCLCRDAWNHKSDLENYYRA